MEYCPKLAMDQRGCVSLKPFILHSKGYYKNALLELICSHGVYLSQDPLSLPTPENNDGPACFCCARTFQLSQVAQLMNNDVQVFHSWYALKLKQPACFVRKCCIKGKSRGYGTIEEIMNKQSPSIKTVQ
ncbi:hypothetical protein NC653_015361 [Populus alba x Populus x berolinensis]|uniref:Uncharacterized protein n=1 Tax=Populus alba x Populus x berolinensis TaxID=444605 RepID=A0AAD6QKJ8_9ROSI|nr:hypothetical protein NC653_015361 [Populus alba x Populus x berolinensis]